MVLKSIANKANQLPHCKIKTKTKTKQKHQLNRVRRPEGGALTPSDSSRAQQEEERPLFFPGSNLANETLWSFCLP